MTRCLNKGLLGMVHVQHLSSCVSLTAQLVCVAHTVMVHGHLARLLGESVSVWIWTVEHYLTHYFHFLKAGTYLLKVCVCAHTQPDCPGPHHVVALCPSAKGLPYMGPAALVPFQDILSLLLGRI